MGSEMLMKRERDRGQREREREGRGSECRELGRGEREADNRQLS